MKKKFLIYLSILLILIIILILIPFLKNIFYEFILKEKISKIKVDNAVISIYQNGNLNTKRYVKGTKVLAEYYQNNTNINNIYSDFEEKKSYIYNSNNLFDVEIINLEDDNLNNNFNQDLISFFNDKNEKFQYIEKITFQQDNVEKKYYVLKFTDVEKNINVFFLNANTYTIEKRLFFISENNSIMTLEYNIDYSNIDETIFPIFDKT